MSKIKPEMGTNLSNLPSCVDKLDNPSSLLTIFHNTDNIVDVIDAIDVAVMPKKLLTAKQIQAKMAKINEYIKFAMQNSYIFGLDPDRCIPVELDDVYEHDK